MEGIKIDISHMGNQSCLCDRVPMGIQSILSVYCKSVVEEGSIILAAQERTTGSTTFGTLSDSTVLYISCLIFNLYTLAVINCDHE